jgi:CspA family cold shock protein
MRQCQTKSHLLYVNDAEAVLSCHQTIAIGWLVGVKVIQPMLCPTCFMKVGPLPKQHGVVKWFNPGKHYGFISVDEGEDVFFHQQQIVQSGEATLEGQTVRFHVRYAKKGPEALNVELAGE